MNPESGGLTPGITTSVGATGTQRSAGRSPKYTADCVEKLTHVASHLGVKLPATLAPPPSMTKNCGSSRAEKLALTPGQPGGHRKPNHLEDFTMICGIGVATICSTMQVHMLDQLQRRRNLWQWHTTICPAMHLNPLKWNVLHDFPNLFCV